MYVLGYLLGVAATAAIIGWVDDDGEESSFIMFSLVWPAALLVVAVMIGCIWAPATLANRLRKRSGC